MTFKEQLVIRILLILAVMFAEDEELSKELKNLRTHIQVNAPRGE